MTKKLTLYLDQPLHEQFVGLAGRQGLSMHAWMLEALSREAFRQLTAESAAWCAANPDTITAQATTQAALVWERGW